MGRAPCCEKVGLKKGRWTAEEDEILVKYITANGEGSWRSLPKNAGLLRCGKSCRLRWINYLRNDLKRGNITKQEEEIIINLHSSFGNRWSLIAGHLPGRTDNEIKNYWNSHLSRRVDVFRRLIVGDCEPIADDLGKLPSSGKRRGGRTSRSAMRKKRSISNPPGAAATAHIEAAGTTEGDQHPTTGSALERARSDVSDLIQANSTVTAFEGPKDPNEDMVSALLWGSTAMMEDMLVGATPEERERDDQQEDPLQGVDEAVVAQRDDQQKEEGGSAGQMVGIEVGMDWDLEEIEAKLWDDDDGGGETWPWIWDDSDQAMLESYSHQFEEEEEEPLMDNYNDNSTWHVPDVM